MRLGYCAFIVAALLIAQSGPSVSAAPKKGDTVGKAGAVTPAAVATLEVGQRREERELSRDAAVKFGEVLATTLSGNAGVIFEDQTRLFVAENSEIEIDEYVYAGKPRLDLVLLRGVIRLASGRIGGEAITIRTSVTRVGLRGTVVSISADADRTVLYVEDGSVVASVGSQTITVNEGQSIVIERDDPGVVGQGWPSDLSAAVSAMSAQLAVVAPVDLAVPAEVIGKANATAVDAAAQSTPSSDSGFGYD